MFKKKNVNYEDVICGKNRYRFKSNFLLLKELGNDNINPIKTFELLTNEQASVKQVFELLKHSMDTKNGKEIIDKEAELELLVNEYKYSRVYHLAMLILSYALVSSDDEKKSQAQKTIKKAMEVILISKSRNFYKLLLSLVCQLAISGTAVWMISLLIRRLFT